MKPGDRVRVQPPEETRIMTASKYYTASAQGGNVAFRSGLQYQCTNQMSVEEARELAGEILAAADEAERDIPEVRALAEDLEDTVSGNFFETQALALVRRGWVKA
jgi:hypothetical protein